MSMKLSLRCLSRQLTSLFASSASEAQKSCRLNPLEAPERPGLSPPARQLMTDEAGTGFALLDEAVLEALGQLQGKYDAEFVARMIPMFMETALILLIRLKEGVANVDITALHH